MWDIFKLKNYLKFKFNRASCIFIHRIWQLNWEGKRHIRKTEGTEIQDNKFPVLGRDFPVGPGGHVNPLSGELPAAQADPSHKGLCGDVKRPGPACPDGQQGQQAPLQVLDLGNL